MLFRSIYTGDRLIKQKYQIWCFTGADEVNFPKLEFDRMVELDVKASTINPEIIVAVVGAEDLIFGIARMWEAHMNVKESGFETMVFRKKQEAVDWIKQKMNGD